MAAELEKLAVKIKCLDNEIIIEKAELQKPEKTLSSHNDHRILMALAVLLCKTGGKISGAEAVRKSFPDYFDIIKSLGAKVGLKED